MDDNDCNNNTNYDNSSVIGFAAFSFNLELFFVMEDLIV